MSDSLKEKIEQLVAYYQKSQKEQEARHMAFMAEAMRTLEARTKDLDLLRDEKRHLQYELALARQEIQDQQAYIRQLQSIPMPNTADAHLFSRGPSTQDYMLGISSHSTNNLQRGCE